MIDATIKNGMAITYPQTGPRQGTKVEGLETEADVIKKIIADNYQYVMAAEAYGERQKVFEWTDATVFEKNFSTFLDGCANLVVVFAAHSGNERKKRGWGASFKIWRVAAHDGHGSGRDTEIRFRQALDAFANTYWIASTYLKNDLRAGGFERRPVFATLTIPRQTVDDKKVKNECLASFLRDMVRTHDVKMFVWKAEAQLRGDIHFHMVLDRFVDWKAMRKNWYRQLCKFGMMKKAGLFGYEIPLNEASRITWVTECDDIDTLKRELSGYFAARRNDEGRIIYKHDKEETVRDIEGRSWGASNNCKVPPLSLVGLDDDTVNGLKAGAIENKEVMNPDRPEYKMCDLHIYKTTNKKPGTKKETVRECRMMPEGVEVVFRGYWMANALRVYGIDSDARLKKLAAGMERATVQIRKKNERFVFSCDTN